MSALDDNTFHDNFTGENMSGGNPLDDNSSFKMTSINNSFNVALDYEISVISQFRKSTPNQIVT